MSNIIPFNFKGAAVRVVDRNGEPWFVAADVCRVLEHSNPTMAVAGLDSEDRDTLNIAEGIAGNPNKTVINESGLYSLILTSRKPEAKVFKKWVTGEVLPQIRKTGGYGAAVIQLNDPATLRGLLLNYTEQVQQLQVEVQEKAAVIEEQTPKVVAFDLLADCTDTLCIMDAAKHLQLPPNQLFSYLEGWRWIYRRTYTQEWIAYQDKIDAGYMTHRITKVDSARNPGTQRNSYQARVTTKGLTKLAQLLKQTAA